MIEWIEFDSPKALKGFPMGDPSLRRFPVYLPPGYSAKSELPVVYFLAGFSGKGAGYINESSAFDIGLPTRFDKAICENRLKPFIGVFPDGSSKLGCSQYVNSPALGNYMDYLCDELVPFIESKFGASSDPHKRFLVGHSSGGFGALVTAFLRPEVFKSICSSAGDGFYEINILPSVAYAVGEIAKAGGVEKFIQSFLAGPSTAYYSSNKFSTMLTLAMAPCYAPNLKAAPVYGDLFFDLHTGEIIPESWEKYLAWDPVRMVEKHAKNIQKLDFILLESGADDEHGLHLAHRQLAKKFQKLGVPHDIQEYPGKHGGHHWRFEDRLTRLLARPV